MAAVESGTGTLVSASASASTGRLEVLSGGRGWDAAWLAWSRRDVGVAAAEW
jgi:hypothetical protein